MLQFTRTLALDHAEDGIRVVALSPGAVLTPRLTEIYGTAEEAEKALKTAYPLGRLGEAEEIAKAALFLASDASSFITGTDLLVDGGYSAQ
jgi:NAD(P)-dependent dehydrogenase (short-subunit alcohol dehydrogenase family)